MKTKEGISLSMKHVAQCCFGLLLVNFLLSGVFGVVHNCYFSGFKSQDLQDKFLMEKVFGSFSDDGVWVPKKKGTFIEAGAKDGVSGSNSYYFEKSLGWKGICVEPTSDNYDLLAHGGRTCSKYHGALGAGTGKERDFLWVTPFAARSGFLEDIPAEKMKTIREWEAKGEVKTEVIKMKDYAVDFLMNQEGLAHIDFFSLDVEGAEYTVLSSINSETYMKISLFMIEVDQSEAARIHALMNENDFEFMSAGGTQYDHIFVRRSSKLYAELQAREPSPFKRLPDYALRGYCW